MRFVGTNWRKLLLLLLLVGVALAVRMSGMTDYLTFNSIKEHAGTLKDFVSQHHESSVVMFCALFVMTALFLPGAVALMLSAGFLFGVVEAVIYVNISATIGAVLAFLCSRYVIGGWIQERFGIQLRQFNAEIDCHGQNYLLFLRIIPLFPFFAVNYLSGITKMAVSKFAMITAIGLIPVSILYAYAGQKVGEIQRVQDLFSTNVVAAFVMLGLFSLLPVILRRWRRLRKRREDL